MVYSYYFIEYDHEWALSSQLHLRIMNKIFHNMFSSIGGGV